MTTPCYVRLGDATERAGLSRRTLVRYAERGRFPRLYRLGAGAKAVRADELEAWLADPEGWVADPEGWTASKKTDKEAC
ncbi:AlpA family phage regulatory protein [Erythrobacteraceae bacterium CFH 75059]|uniref:helix-turn-helix transcriptional regulator n=1 Tax=Qipengyuania thermophila TaxID=2509361 RepID=UPI0010211A6B|nr:AlpA family phage regulatory protein [Qipengyuania thermophila]TCD00706.1 AlpA family phage regulatory protein [Erythrobacteraceae bacterium CFH 75059]